MRSRLSVAARGLGAVLLLALLLLGLPAVLIGVIGLPSSVKRQSLNSASDRPQRSVVLRNRAGMI